MKVDILEIGNPILRKHNKKVLYNEINSLKIQKLIDDLIDTMHAVGGAGLAANQISQSYKVCVVEIKNNDRYHLIPEIPLTVLINPKITFLNSSETFSSYEGCLSVPNIRARVDRHCEIHLDAWDRKGNIISEDIYGYKAIVYQHEIDHLNGIIFTDLVKDKRSIVTYKNYQKYFSKLYELEICDLLKKYN